jgi:alpha-glucosidase
MPWLADAPMAGFSSAAETWLPVDDAHLPLAVDRQMADPASMLAFTRDLIAVRKAMPALQLGAVRIVESPEGVLAFERVLGETRVLCLFELSGQPATVSLPGVDGAKVLMAWPEGDVRRGSVHLAAYGGAILTL